MTAATEVIEALEGLRAAVADARNDPKRAVEQALDAAPFEDGQIVTEPGGEAIDHALVTLADPLPLGDLEEAFGAGRELPRRPSPSTRRQVLFEATLPAEGSVGSTVLAELDDDGLVHRVVVRRDEM